MFTQFFSGEICQLYSGPDLGSLSTSLGKSANHIRVQTFKDTHVLKAGLSREDYDTVVIYHDNIYGFRSIVSSD